MEKIVIPDNNEIIPELKRGITVPTLLKEPNGIDEFMSYTAHKDSPFVKYASKFHLIDQDLCRPDKNDMFCVDRLTYTELCAKIMKCLNNDGLKKQAETKQLIIDLNKLTVDKNGGYRLSKLMLDRIQQELKTKK